MFGCDAFMTCRLVNVNWGVLLPKAIPCWLRTQSVPFSHQYQRGNHLTWILGLDCFFNKAFALAQDGQRLCKFSRLPPKIHTHTLENTLPSACKASASCLTSLIYKANRMFLLTHITLSLLMKKTIPGGQPRRPSEPASKNSSNTQRFRSSKMIFHTMK